MYHVFDGAEIDGAQRGLVKVTVVDELVGAGNTGQGMPQSSRHHNSFNPNCTWRELVVVEVITPAVGDGSPVAAA